MGGIFLSYRRADTGDVAGRLHDRLAARFGAAGVFRDVDDIPPGENFRTRIAAAIAASDVVLVLIGAAWRGADAAGAARIDDPEDVVRIEVETALAAEAAVLPVLVGGAEMPPARALPASLAPLADLNALRLRPDPDFGRDVAALLAALRARRGGRRRVLAGLGLAAGAAALAALLLVAWPERGGENTARAGVETQADPPLDLGAYYAGLRDLRGAELKRGLARLTRRDHRVISYREAREHVREIHEDAFFPGRLRAFYDDRLVPVDGYPEAWNREHIWPRSYGYAGFEPARADLHNLVAADPRQNALRANLPFTADPAEAEGRRAFLVEESASGDIRGDLARILFYMAVRYEGVGGDPDLELTDQPLTVEAPRFGPLSLLLAWHAADPVSLHEREVNERVYRIQNNRNPFVDHPALVALIWPAG